MFAEADTKLTTYRLFWINKTGHVFSVPDTVDAQDDAEAVRQAEKMARGRMAEVWDMSRKVAMLNGAGRH